MALNMKTNDLEDVKLLANQLIAKFGLNGWEFSFSNAKNQSGVAGIFNDKKKIIISKFYALHQKNIKALTNTILHEIAHAIDIEKRGYTNHDKNWKKIAKSIVCTAEVSKDPESESNITRKELCVWIAKCPNCGKFHYAHRRQRLTCMSYCDKYNNGKPTKKYIFNYSQNKHKIL
jgi:predicted SprT family Zn-dependent metalloprotease